jgi:hypothetical protein
MNPHSQTVSVGKRLDMKSATVLRFLSETAMAKYRQHLKITCISNTDYEWFSVSVFHHSRFVTCCQPRLRVNNLGYYLEVFRAL